MELYQSRCSYENRAPKLLPLKGVLYINWDYTNWEELGELGSCQIRQVSLMTSFGNIGGDEETRTHRILRSH